MPAVEDVYQKRFNEEDKQWSGPKLIVLGVVTLVICISLIFYMSTTTGCSLQIVP